MNRRSFLGSLLATAVLDPERLLWVPGRKTIFLPPTSPWSAHFENIKCSDTVSEISLGYRYMTTEGADFISMSALFMEPPESPSKPRRVRAKKQIRWVRYEL